MWLRHFLIRPNAVYLISDVKVTFCLADAINRVPTSLNIVIYVKIFGSMSSVSGEFNIKKYKGKTIAVSAVL